MITFIIIWSIWFISELLLNIFFHSANNIDDQDKGSMRIIWFTIAVSVDLGIIISIFFKFSLSRLIFLPYAGLFLIIAGMIFRFIAVWTLGKYFTVNVTIKENHQIIKVGLYKIIRHPSYLGSLVSFIGFGISLNNWISLILIIVPITIAFIHRIEIEERLLLKQFGLEYSEYIKKTYRLVPNIY